MRAETFFVCCKCALKVRAVAPPEPHACGLPAGDLIPLNPKRQRRIAGQCTYLRCAVRLSQPTSGEGFRVSEKAAPIAGNEFLSPGATIEGARLPWHRQGVLTFSTTRELTVPLPTRGRRRSPTANACIRSPGPMRVARGVHPMTRREPALTQATSRQRQAEREGWADVSRCRGWLSSGLELRGVADVLRGQGRHAGAWPAQAGRTPRAGCRPPPCRRVHRTMPLKPG